MSAERWRCKLAIDAARMLSNPQGAGLTPRLMTFQTKHTWIIAAADGVRLTSSTAWTSDALAQECMLTVNIGSGSVARSHRQGPLDDADVWGLDAKLKMKIGDLLVLEKQHTEGRQADSRPMPDLSVNGLQAVDSVGGWPGVDGALGALALLSSRIDGTPRSWMWTLSVATLS